MKTKIIYILMMGLLSLNVSARDFVSGIQIFNWNDTNNYYKSDNGNTLANTVPVYLGNTVSMTVEQYIEIINILVDGVVNDADRLAYQEKLIMFCGAQEDIRNNENTFDLCVSGNVDELGTVSLNHFSMLDSYDYHLEKIEKCLEYNEIIKQSETYYSGSTSNQISVNNLKDKIDNCISTYGGSRKAGDVFTEVISNTVTNTGVNFGYNTETKNFTSSSSYSSYIAAMCASKHNNLSSYCTQMNNSAPYVETGISVCLGESSGGRNTTQESYWGTGTCSENYSSTCSETVSYACTKDKTICETIPGSGVTTCNTYPIPSTCTKTESYSCTKSRTTSCDANGKTLKQAETNGNIVCDTTKSIDVSGYNENIYTIKSDDLDSTKYIMPIWSPSTDVVDFYEEQTGKNCTAQTINYFIGLQNAGVHYTTVGTQARKLSVVTSKGAWYDTPDKSFSYNYCEK